ncbi:MAG: SRPBCC domain-containing protein, partial [Ramlibacter sp.]
QVGGKIAQMGQRLIDGVAKSMAEDFFRRFDDEMQRRYPQAAPVPAAATAAPESGGGLPSWVWIVVAVAAVLGVIWFAR